MIIIGLTISKFKLLINILRIIIFQGKEGYRQPTVTDDFAFLWNGDVFEYSGNPLPSDFSDTEFLVKELR